MIFLRDFYDEDGKVSTKNMWVWYIHILSYSYIIYTFWTHNSLFASELSEMWIPLDIILTINIAFYQYINVFMQIQEDIAKKEIEDAELELEAAGFPTSINDSLLQQKQKENENEKTGDKIDKFHKMS